MRQDKNEDAFGKSGRPPRAWPSGSLLGSLSVPSRDRLLQLGSLVQYPAGKTLIREGDASRFVVVILDGVVKVTGHIHSGRDALLSIRMSGDVVGEFAALDEGPRSASVITCGAVVGRFIKAGEFLDGLRRDPDLSRALSRSVVAKTRAANARRIDFSGCAISTRLYRVLYEIAVTYGTATGNRSVIRWPLTQPELASLASAAEPSVHRVLRELRTKGIIATGYRRITVLDLARLHALGYPGGDLQAD
jgi:CRP/FNR family transcriptional regulator, cyclic AMP receptor protein